MAYSTQKDFMKLNSLERQCTPLEPKDAYSVDIKHYFSCYDARAWSIDPSQRNQYLSDVIACCQDNSDRVCTPACFCDKSHKCDMGERIRYDMSEGKHSNKEINELSRISNTVKIESGQRMKRKSEQKEINRSSENNSSFDQKKQNIQETAQSNMNETVSTIFEKNTKVQDKNDRESFAKLESKTQKQSQEVFNNHKIEDKEILRQNENEKVVNELTDDAESLSSDHVKNIEIFNVNEQDHEQPSTDNRDVDRNESSLSDNTRIIRDSTLEFIFMNEKAKDRRPWEISYDFPRPVSQRPPIGYFVGEGDCEERRQHVRELIKIKGEETLAELMQVLHKYERKFEYYKQICKDRKARLESGDTIQLQKNTQISKKAHLERRVKSIQPTKQPFSESVATPANLANHAKRPGNQLLDSRSMNISYMHPTPKLQRINNPIHQINQNTVHGVSSSQSTSRPDRMHRHEDLFFHKPTSIFHFENTRRALDIVEDNMNVFTNNIDVTSNELVGAVKKLSQVIQEFAEFKNTIENMLQVDNSNLNRLANEAGPSGWRGHQKGPNDRRHNANTFQMKNNFPGRQFERKSAGADTHCKYIKKISASKNKNELLERCRNALAEIHKHFTKQRCEIQNVNACKGQWTDVLEEHRKAFLRLHQYNCDIHRRSEEIRQCIADIEASFDDVNVTGFTKYRSKCECSCQTETSSQSALCYDLGVDLHIEKLSFENLPTDGKMKNVIEAKITKLQNEIELISDRIAYKTMICNSQLETECKVKKEKEETERNVLKMCRKIRALEAKALKIKTAIVGKDKIIYNPFEQFCSKRALKRIKILQLDLQRIRATADFKANLLQAVKEAQNRSLHRNECLKQDIDTARSTIEELENHINKFQTVVCGEVYKPYDDTKRPKDSSTSFGSSGKRTSAKIVKPSPPDSPHEDKTSEATIPKTEHDKPCGSADNIEAAASEEHSKHVSSREHSQVDESLSQDKTSSTELPPTSEIEIEIPPTTNSPIEQAPSLIVIQSPVELQPSDSCSEKKTLEKRAESKHQVGDSLAEIAIVKNQSEISAYSIPITQDQVSLSDSRASVPELINTLPKIDESNSISSKSLKPSSPIKKTLTGQIDSATSTQVLIPKKISALSSTGSLLSGKISQHHRTPDKHKSSISQTHSSSSPHLSDIRKESLLHKRSSKPIDAKIVDASDHKDRVYEINVSKRSLLSNATNKTISSTRLDNKQMRKTTSENETVKLSKHSIKNNGKLRSKMSIISDKFVKPPKVYQEHLSRSQDMTGDSAKVKEKLKSSKAILSDESVKHSDHAKNIDKGSRISMNHTIHVGRDGKPGTTIVNDEMAKPQKIVSGYLLPPPNSDKLSESSKYSIKPSVKNKEKDNFHKEETRLSGSKTNDGRFPEKSISPNENKQKISESVPKELELDKLKINKVEIENNIKDDNIKDDSIKDDKNNIKDDKNNIKDDIKESNGNSSLEDGKNNFEVTQTAESVREEKMSDARMADPKNTEHTTATGMPHFFEDNNGPEKNVHEYPKASSKANLSGIQKEDELCKKCFEEVENLKTELSILQDKSKQLNAQEELYRNQIKKLEDDLKSAKQVDQQHVVVERVIAEGDCTEWIQKHGLKEDEFNMLQKLHKDQKEALAKEQSKSLEYQQQTVKMETSLLACQKELESLQQIHSQCKTVNIDNLPDCTDWENMVQSLQFEVHTLKNTLIEKEELIKKLQTNQILTESGQNLEDFKNKWLSCESELQVCKKQLETLYNGGTDGIIKELNEQLTNYEQESIQLRDKVVQADNDIASMGQRLSDAIRSLNNEKQLSSDLRNQVDEYQRKLTGSENQQIQNRKLEKDFDTSTKSLASTHYKTILQKQNSTLRYLCQLQTSVKDLLIQLRSVINKECPNYQQACNAKCFCNSDDIRYKIEKICICLERLGMPNRHNVDECTCSKKSRLEKICAKILQKGIDSLKWDDIVYLHEIVYKTGCAMRGLSVCQTPGECQCCGDAVRDAVQGEGGVPERKISQLKKRSWWRP